ncbi:diaminopimelate epimerase [Methylovirgula sp. HY1]|uniref:diaminopimelate epimerase n=1 Tax=Methylovirgula sp. HY1 TaxID=2822761 RepID=UPI001C5B5B4A|nr:diaminopimelate epimerase [Methylovirgula sp. HY1]QXX75189.1 Diaminopimelate epimerase [Methylovirgula sp. HY1]
MHPLAGRQVTKMNGLGNEIVILDLRATAGVVDAAMVRAIGRGDGLGFDQLMVLRDPRCAGTEAFVQIYNSDGSEAGACGNGTRCVAWYLMRSTSRETLKVETAAGLLQCWRRDEWRFAVDMGVPHMSWQEIPLREAVPDTSAIALSFAADAPPLMAAMVNMGNPHAIIFVDDLARFDLAAIGPKLEHHSLFPERANISLAQVVAADHIVVKVWERGAGITRACGSAACATLVAAARKRLSARTATISLPGGDLAITWRDDDHVVMEGPVELEFETTLDATLFADAPA